MLNKKEIEIILNQSLDRGADFAELFFENTYTNSLQITNNEISSVNSNNIFGVGIRLFKGIQEVYGYTNDISLVNILSFLENLKLNFQGSANYVVPLTEMQDIPNNVQIPYVLMNTRDKAQKMLELSVLMQNYDTKIIQTCVNFSEKEQKVLIANTKGVYQQDVRNYIKCNFTAIAQKDQLIQDASEVIGYSMGLEFFDLVDLEKLSLKAAKRAVVLLNAQAIEPQKMPVVLHNGFGGVILHEACGHCLEATAIAKGFSPFCNKLNQKIASELVTVYDDGNIKNSWGSLNFDDEGAKTQKNLLIENGILKSYLIDFRHSLQMKMSSTGSARRQSYKYSPTSRMNSTYIDIGKDDPEQIIRDTAYGLYAKSFSGGTVIPLTGEFNFVVNEAYLIENGKITVPVKGAMLIGYASDILQKIDRVANDLKLSQGLCGSISGSIPVDIGQPTIRVQEMIVGGSLERK